MNIGVLGMQCDAGTIDSKQFYIRLLVHDQVEGVRLWVPVMALIFGPPCTPGNAGMPCAL